MLVRSALCEPWAESCPGPSAVRFYRVVACRPRAVRDNGSILGKSPLSRHGRMSALGHEQTLRDLNNVRFTPESGHMQCKQECPLWAKSGHRADLRETY